MGTGSDAGLSVEAGVGPLYGELGSVGRTAPRLEEGGGVFVDKLIPETWQSGNI